MESIQRCTRCVMDNRSDPFIVFDEHGVCNYCTDAFVDKKRIYFPDNEGESLLRNKIAYIKDKNKNKKYDCLMGISGGLDSTYLAYIGAMKWNLRILAVHIDDGFDTEISKRNLENLCRKAHIDLINIKPDPNIFNDLIKAYMRAGVPNLAVPQDNVVLANIYKFMRKEKINIFLSGANFSTESILQKGNTYDAYDLRNIKDIHQRFGERRLQNLDLLSSTKNDVVRFILKIEKLHLLNYVDYKIEQAMNELNVFSGYEYYGNKHLENNLTKFIQLYWFYNKFNVDKRTSHFSSLIISNQMTREKALSLLEKPLYDEKEMEKLIDDILLKIEMSREEFNHIMASKPQSHSDYKTSKYIQFKCFLRKRLIRS